MSNSPRREADLSNRKRGFGGVNMVGKEVEKGVNMVGSLLVSKTRLDFDGCGTHISTW